MNLYIFLSSKQVVIIPTLIISKYIHNLDFTYLKISRSNPRKTREIEEENRFTENPREIDI